jgi:lysophospholipase L1-like esterase
MKIGMLILLVVIACSMSPVKKVKVIFFGDSITQMGVEKGGYVDRVKTMLVEKKLPDEYEIIGAGIGGNKVYDLYLRMDDDVLAKNPDVVVIYIGVNDVWHKSSHGTGTDENKFEGFYNAIIKKLQAKHIKVILATPAVIGERHDNSNPQDGDLNRYSEVIRRIAKTYNCTLVDLRKSFMTYSLQNNPQNNDKGILTTDRVHLNEKGNQLVAEKMIEALLNN